MSSDPPLNFNDATCVIPPLDGRPWQDRSQTD